MLGGKLPFESSVSGELIQMQLTADPEPLTGLRPETPPGIDRLVRRMLAKDPALRPQNVAEVVSLLDQALAQSESSDNETEELKIVAPAEETTIQRRPNPNAHAAAMSTDIEEVQTTQPARIDPQVTFSTNIISTDARPARWAKPRSLYALVMLGALAAGIYGIYSYGLNRTASDTVQMEGRPGREEGVGKARPSPEPTAVQTPTPAPSPTATAPPETPLEADRPVDTSPNSNRARANRKQEKERLAQRRQEDQRLAERHFEQARALYQGGQYSAAVDECDAALRLNPQHKGAKDLRRKVNKIIKILNGR
jgi:hypothetical protein